VDCLQYIRFVDVPTAQLAALLSVAEGLIVYSHDKDLIGAHTRTSRCGVPPGATSEYSVRYQMAAVHAVKSLTWTMESRVCSVAYSGGSSTFASSSRRPLSLRR
jgi:hypothetical protein